MIRRYIKEKDEARLFNLLKEEGLQWSCYWVEEFADQYKAALENSITYVACQDDLLCGYLRALNDSGFFIYICDLLISPEHRGQGLGRDLILRLKRDYPEQAVYVMSSVDEYYRKLGFKWAGSLFKA